MDGSGWDITHGAVVNRADRRYHANKQFINCHFAHWRGEMLKSVVALDTGFIGVTNCAFWDGDASGFNFYWTPHVINGCLFSNLDMAMDITSVRWKRNSKFRKQRHYQHSDGYRSGGSLVEFSASALQHHQQHNFLSEYDILHGACPEREITGNTFYWRRVGLPRTTTPTKGTDINGILWWKTINSTEPTIHWEFMAVDRGLGSST